MCRIPECSKAIEYVFTLLHVLSTPRGPPARKSSHLLTRFLFTSCTVQFGSSLGFALKFFLFSARPPQKSVNLMVNLLLLLFHPHPHPRRLLFAPYYTYVPVIMEIQVTLQRQRICFKDLTSRRGFFWQVPVLLRNFNRKFFVTGTAVIRELGLDIPSGIFLAGTGTAPSRKFFVTGRYRYCSESEIFRYRYCCDPGRGFWQVSVLLRVRIFSLPVLL